MPVQLFTEAERARHDHFPKVIVYDDLITFFTLSVHDLERYRATVRYAGRQAFRRGFTTFLWHGRGMPERTHDGKKKARSNREDTVFHRRGHFL